MKKEARAFEYMVSSVVSALLGVLLGVVDWKKFSGLNMEIVARDRIREKEPKELNVRVHPVGWPENDHIFLRAQKLYDEWTVLEGTLHLMHLQDADRFIGFCVHEMHGTYQISPRIFGPSELLQGAIKRAGERMVSVLDK